MSAADTLLDGRTLQTVSKTDESPFQRSDWYYSVHGKVMGTFLRVFVSFSAACLIVLAFAFTLSLTLQAAYLLYTETDLHVTMFVFVEMPLIATLSAFGLSMWMQFSLDAMDNAPLVRCRAAILVMLSKMALFEVSQASANKVDTFTISSLLGCIGIGILRMAYVSTWASQVSSETVEFLLCGVVVGGMIFTVVLSAASFICRCAVFMDQDRTKVWAQVISTEVADGFDPSKEEEKRSDLEEKIRKSVLDRALHGSWSNTTTALSNLGCGLLGYLACLASLCILRSFLHADAADPRVWVTAITLIGYLGSTLWMLRIVMQNVPSRVLGPYALVLSVYMLTPVLFIGWNIGKPVTDADSLKESDFFYKNATEPIDPDKYLWDSYPICSMRWGPKSDLSISDLAEFAVVTYRKVDEDVQKQLDREFQNTPIVAKHVGDLPDYEEIGRYFRFEIPESKVCVFAIRGSHNPRDFLYDAKTWASPAALKMGSRFAPILKFLPENLVRILIARHYLQHANENLNILTGESIWNQRVEQALNFTNECAEKGYKTIVVGHSLGGGLAQIVGSRLGLPVVGFNPVGLGLSAYVFDIKLNSARMHLVNIISHGDVVPKSDQQVGMNQHINCDKGLLCHMMHEVRCELWKSCGDPYGREPASCDPPATI